MNNQCSSNHCNYFRCLIENFVGLQLSNKICLDDIVSLLFFVVDIYSVDNHDPRHLSI